MKGFVTSRMCCSWTYHIPVHLLFHGSSQPKSNRCKLLAHRLVHFATRVFHAASSQHSQVQKSEPLIIRFFLYVCSIFMDLLKFCFTSRKLIGYWPWKMRGFMVGVVQRLNSISFTYLILNFVITIARQIINLWIREKPLLNSEFQKFVVSSQKWFWVFHAFNFSISLSSLFSLIASQKTSLPAIYKLSWILSSVTHASALMVTIVYWTLIYSGEFTWPSSCALEFQLNSFCKKR